MQGGWGCFYVSRLEVKLKLLMLLNILRHYLTLVNIRKCASQHRSKLLTVVFNGSINVICAREMLCVCVYVFLLRKNLFGEGGCCWSILKPRASIINGILFIFVSV